MIVAAEAGGVVGRDADRERLRRKYRSLGLGESLVEPRSLSRWEGRSIRRER